MIDRLPRLPNWLRNLDDVSRFITLFSAVIGSLVTIIWAVSSYVADLKATIHGLQNQIAGLQQEVAPIPAQVLLLQKEQDRIGRLLLNSIDERGRQVTELHASIAAQSERISVVAGNLGTRVEGLTNEMRAVQGRLDRIVEERHTERMPDGQGNTKGQGG